MCTCGLSVTVFPLVCRASLFQKASKDSELCNLGPGPSLLLMMTVISVFWRELHIWNRIQKQQAVDQKGQEQMPLHTATHSHLVACLFG